MGKISDYANVLKSKLTDLFVVYQRNDGELETKNATLEQLGNAICGEQVHATLKTEQQTIIGGINELAKDKNVADEYDDTHTYNTGDVTIYGNTLYICNTNNTTGTFDPSKWTATTIDNVIGSLSQLTTSDKSSLVGAVNEVVSNYTAKEVTYTGSTTAQGFLVSDIDFTTKIRGSYVTDSSTGKYFCILRPSSTYKVVAMVINDNLLPEKNKPNYTLHVFYSDK